MTTRPILTLCDLENLLPFATDKERISYLTPLNHVCSTFCINTPPRIALFFAQLEILTNELKTISALNEDIINDNAGIIEPSIANMFYPIAFLWSTKDCNTSADVGLVGLVTKKLCGSYHRSTEKVKVFHRNQQYYLPKVN